MTNSVGQLTKQVITYRVVKGLKEWRMNSEAFRD